MVIIWGTSLYGKVDHVQGLFYVKSRFFHLYWIPLIPLGSVLILDGSETGEGYRGVEVPLSFKSVAMAYLRMAVLAGGLIFTIMCLVHFGSVQQRPEHLTTAILTGLMAVAAVVVGYIVFTMTHPEPHRAAELAQHLGLDPDAVVGYLNGESMPEEAPPPQDNHGFQNMPLDGPEYQPRSEEQPRQHQ